MIPRAGRPGTAEASFSRSGRRERARDLDVPGDRGAARESPRECLRERPAAGALTVEPELGAQAVEAAEAEQQLGTAVDVYLDGGPAGDPVPSTIVDLTGDTPRVLRLGALSVEELRAVVPALHEAE